MNKTDWLMKFRRCRSAETLETVYEHLMYSDHTEEQYEITRAYVTVRLSWLQASFMTVFLLMCGDLLSESTIGAFHQKLAQRIQKICIR